MTKDWLDFFDNGDFKIWLERKEAEKFSFKVATYNRFKTFKMHRPIWIIDFYYNF